MTVLKRINILMLSSIMMLSSISIVSAETSSDMPDTNELLILAEEGTTKKEISGMLPGTEATLDNISTLDDGTRMAKITVSDPENTEDIRYKLENEDSVITVQPNYIYDLFENESTLNAASKDPGATQQWYLSSKDKFPGSTDAYNAWDLLSENYTPVTIAVIDTGCQLDHPDITRIQKDKCVSFNNGKKGTFDQWDSSDDENGHGTHICGIIAAENGNDTGIAGIGNNRLELLPIDVTLKNTTAVTTQDAVLAINYAVTQGAKVINMSFGSAGYDGLFEQAIRNASDNGTVCVCAAGNDSTSKTIYPSDASAAISVMAHTKKGEKALFSNYGNDRDISAPGKLIYSTYKDSGYGNLDGTSMAAPIVSGIAGLLFTENPDLTPREIKNLIYTSSGSEAFDPDVNAFGIVDLKTAINNLHDLGSEDPSRVVLNYTESELKQGSTLKLEYAVYPGTSKENAVFASSNENVATVDNNGVITAKGPGKANITVTAKGAASVCAVSVKDITYTTIDLPAEVTGTLESSDPVIKIQDNGSEYETEVDGYEMELAAGEKISVALSPNTLKCRILDPDSKEIECDNTFTAEKAGIYRFQVIYKPEAIRKSIEYTFRTEHIHSLSQVKSVEPTCTEPGCESYYKCETCSKCFSDPEGNDEISILPVIPSLGHDWSEPSYTWAEDYSSVTAKHFCIRNEDHSEQETAAASVEVIKAPTIEEEGLKRYTAEFENGSFETQTIDVVTNKEEIEWGAPVYTWAENNSSVTARRTCLSDSSLYEEETVGTTYSLQSDAGCIQNGIGRYTSDSFENSAFTVQTKQVVIPMTGHEWSDPVYIWSSDNRTVTAERTCKKDPSHKETETAVTDQKLISAGTCVEKSSVQYTASFDNPAFTVQKKTAPADYGAHNWNDPVYIWSSDNKKVTATRTCRNDPSHRETETVSSKQEIVKTGTCISKGSVQYTAVFENSAFAAQKKTVTTEYGQHSWYSPVYTWSSDNKKVTATRTCRYNSSHKETETVTAAETVTKKATCADTGTKSFTSGKFSNTAFSIQTKTVVIPKDESLHRWGTPSCVWSGDNLSVTATVKCLNDSSHKKTETVKTSLVISKAATTSSMGETTYTARFSNQEFKTQTKRLTNIPKLQPASRTVKDLPNIKIKKITRAKKSFTVKWKKPVSSKAQWIQIQYCTNKKFASGVKTKYVKKTVLSKKIKNLKSKKKYYVRLRLYGKEGNITHISDWSCAFLKTK